MTPRQRWKRYYRAFRIIRRETIKAHLDMVAFGTGAVLLLPEPAVAQHVPIDQLVIREPHD